VGAVVRDHGELCSRHRHRCHSPDRLDLADHREEEGGVAALVGEQLVGVDPAGRSAGDDAMRGERRRDLTDCPLIPGQEIADIHRGRDGRRRGRRYLTVLDHGRRRGVFDEVA